MLNNIFIRLFIVFTLLSPLACTSKKDSANSMYSSFSSMYYASGDSAFKSEIIQKEKMLLNSFTQTPLGKKHAKLLLQLTMLYSHKNNPNPNFSMAIKHLRQYSLLKDQVSVEYAKALLNDILENKIKYDIINTKYEKLIKEKKKLEKSYSKLVIKMQSTKKTLQKQKKIIKKKNEIIEKLKVLDIQLENRRADTD